ncbi:hypothetical protein L1S32_10805 [Methanogenium sp. S4BF]|uniref:hypothetical protein n=1 Tax=Methanogenium sp. S4BF TaxID=1789226 RepID=UPI002416D0C9|nr:hypothetical protein [Methanogenium sp. S4BF]WFN34316.1 hypothetical protein L1S32_10805 [Methanogenium sp. S4BF]
MKFRGIISVIIVLLFVTCSVPAGAAGDAESGILFSLEPVAGVQDEFLLSCAGADNGPAGIFATFPGPFAIVSTTLPESQYRANGTGLACALIDEDACQVQFRCADLQPGTLRISWEEFTGGLSGEAIISVSDAGGVSVLTGGNSGIEDTGNQPSSPVQQSPFACIAFTAFLSLAAAGVYAGRNRRDVI